MKRWASFAAVVCALVGASIAIAWSSPSHNALTGNEIRYLHTYHVGPSSTCETDVCGQGIVKPIAMHLPPAGGHKYSGTVSVSLGYLTSRTGLFRVSLVLRTYTNHLVGTIEPSSRVLAPAPARDSTTVVFQVADVPANTDLELSPSVAASVPRSGRTSITTTNMLVEARLSSG